MRARTDRLKPLESHGILESIFQVWKVMKVECFVVESHEK